MMGGTFAWHPKFQKFKVKILDLSHPSLKGLPKEWEKEDEFYFQKELFPGTITIAANDITTLNMTDTVQKNLILKNAGTYTELYPSVWTHNYDGGYIWITTLGHHKNDYSDALYVQHIFQGIRYIASQVKKLDFTKAYADSRDTPVRY